MIKINKQYKPYNTASIGSLSVGTPVLMQEDVDDEQELLYITGFDNEDGLITTLRMRDASPCTLHPTQEVYEVQISITVEKIG